MSAPAPQGQGGSSSSGLLGGLKSALGLSGSGAAGAGGTAAAGISGPKSIKTHAPPVQREDSLPGKPASSAPRLARLCPRTSCSGFPAWPARRGWHCAAPPAPTLAPAPPWVQRSA